VRGVRVDGVTVMERALRLLLVWGFAARGLETVIWWAHQGNWASRRLAWKVGFAFVPGVVPAWLPQRGQLRDAWLGTLRRGASLAPGAAWPADVVAR
jgi:RimJ/RimL family protein N-acetyltransferase